MYFIKIPCKSEMVDKVFEEIKKELDICLNDDLSTSKRYQLSSWLNKNYVNTKKVSKDVGKIYKR
jgi:hypothetical protein